MASSILVIDESGRIEFAGGTSSLFSLPALGYVGRNVSEVLPGIDLSTFSNLSNDARLPEPITARGEDGSEIQVDVSVSIHDDGTRRRLILHLADLSAHHEREDELRRLRQEHRLLFDRNLAGVYRSRLDGTIFDCNDTCARILGFRDREDYLQQSRPSPFMESSDLASILEGLRREEVVSGIETGMIRKDGTPVLVIQNLALVTSDDGDTIEATMFDITRARIAEEQVEYQAHHDTLTGLANPVLFEHRVDEAILNAASSGRYAGLLLIDLDEFKAVNDTIGYGVGNQLLQLVAYRLQKSLRDGDTIARLGGDEFTVILQSLREPDDAVRIAEKLRDEITKPYLIEGNEIYVTASIGISTYPDDGSRHEDLMRNADIAMYQAKHVGRNQIRLCSQATSAEAIERMTLESDLRLAIDRKEFVLHFQPQVDAVDSRVHALEALVRWNHPKRGLIMPNEFIPLAERSHLMIEIGRWVLTEACRTIARWSDIDPPVRIAVNVSPRQFQDPTFLDQVRESLATSGLNPSQLELEITEGVAMQNPEAALETLNHLKGMGVRISIDDFGTGYSSLSYLTKFPIDCLKIDQGFVRDIEKGGGESAIIAAVIALAHQLKLHVIAEGVETSAQLDFLVGQRCQSLQGYFYSRPQPAEAIEKMIRDRE